MWDTRAVNVISTNILFKAYKKRKKPLASLDRKVCSRTKG